MVSISMLAPLPLHPDFMVQLTEHRKKNGVGGGEQASEVSRVDSEKLRLPPFLHWGEGEKR